MKRYEIDSEIAFCANSSFREIAQIVAIALQHTPTVKIVVYRKTPLRLCRSCSPGTEGLLILLNESCCHLNHEVDVFFEQNETFCSIKVRDVSSSDHCHVVIQTQRELKHIYLVNHHLPNFNVAYVRCSETGSQKISEHQIISSALFNTGTSMSQIA